MKIYLKNAILSVRPRGRKAGSIITEAAIMLPVYIIAVVTLVYITRMCHTDIIVFSVMENEVHEASAMLTLPLCSGAGAAAGSAGLDGSMLDVSWMPGGITGGYDEIDQLYKISFKYDTRIAAPAVFRKNVVINNTIIARNWNGKEIKGADPFGFERMTVDENGNVVCVFPRAGGRYHGTGCRYVNSYAVEVALDSEIKSKYKACPLCADGKEGYGSTVYIFRYGSSYHNAGCDSVDKYVMEMDRADAVIKNYSPCSVCGGN